MVEHFPHGLQPLERVCFKDRNELLLVIARKKKLKSDGEKTNKRNEQELKRNEVLVGILRILAKMKCSTKLSKPWHTFGRSF